MEKYIPYEKLSKKKQKEQNAKQRGSWYGINPVTRRAKNGKAYDRKKARKWSEDLPNRAFSASYLSISPTAS